MKNNTNYIALATAVLSSVASVVLTVTFMYGLLANSPTAIVMAAVGLCLELGKIMFAREAGLSSGVRALSYSGLCALMMGISVLASYAALEGGFDNAAKQSTEHLAITKQISQLEELYQSQLGANQVTRANDTMNEIQQLSTRLSELPPESSVVRHANVISLIASLALELVCVVSVSLSSGMLRSQDNDIGTKQDDIKAKPAAVKVVREPEPFKVVTFEAKTTMEQEIKEAVVTKMVSPSVRGVREMFTGISNDRISAVLKELGSAGVLEQKGRGWQLAS